MKDNSVVGAVDPPQQVLFTFLFYTMEFPLVTYRPIVPKIVSNSHPKVHSEPQTYFCTVLGADILRH